MKDWLKASLIDLRGLRDEHYKQYWVHVGAVQAVELIEVELMRREEEKSQEELKQAEALSVAQAKKGKNEINPSYNRGAASRSTHKSRSS